MMNTAPLALETVWFDKYKYEDAERQFHERNLQDVGTMGGDSSEVLSRLSKLEDENKRLRNVAESVNTLTQNLNKLVKRVEELELGKTGKPVGPCGGPMGCGTPPPTCPKSESLVSAAAAVADEDDIDLFGSDGEDAEKEKIKAERLKAYEEKKSKKPALIAKSNIILDVKPWDDETDMKSMESKVRAIAMEGLLWGASKLVPLAFGIHKLQISCVIEDDKVSVDLLQEQIESIEDLVQSVDIAAFNKV